MATTITRIPCGIVNCYLVRQAGTAILVDAAGPGSASRIETALSKQGVSAKALKMILLTHGHSDHTGAAAYFREQYGIPIALHPADCHPGPLQSRGLFGAFLKAASGRGAPSPPPAYDISLEHMEDLEAYGISARLLPLPGHTPGSVGLLVNGTQLIAGDMYMNFFSPIPAAIAESYPTHRQTHEYLKTLDIQTIHPGHGRAFAFSKIP